MSLMSQCGWHAERTAVTDTGCHAQVFTAEADSTSQQTNDEKLCL